MLPAVERAASDSVAGIARPARTKPVSTGSSNPRLGIILRVVSGVLFALMTLFVKLASDSIGLGQIVLFRSTFAMIPLVIFLMVRNEFPQGLATKRPWGHLLRSGFGTAAMFASFAAIARLPLADATLVNYTTPLITSLLGGILLGEALTRPRITGLLLGLAGVLVLTVPEMLGTEVNITRLTGFGLGLLASGLSSIAYVQVRRLGTTESPGAIAFYFVLVASLASLPLAIQGWVTPSGTELTFLILAGLLGGLAHIAMTLAFRYAEVSLLAPFEYLMLLWAGGLDLLFFQTPLGPTFFVALPLLLLGAAVSSGRLRRRRRSARLVDPE